ncbi:MAG TPA: peptide ABC transporter permease, partial [Gammaproteobacteria bacterium]|nr:peptide ABC transporter permease [Gammaproteobacteria bacterium]
MRIGTIISFSVVVAWLVIALISPFVINGVNAVDLEQLFSGPSKNGFFGYDDLGRDIGL